MFLFMLPSGAKQEYCKQCLFHHIITVICANVESIMVRKESFIYSISKYPYVCVPKMSNDIIQQPY